MHSIERRHWFAIGILIVAMSAVCDGRSLGDDPATPGSPETLTAVPDAEHLESLVARVKESVVVISFSGRDGTQQGLGSGFVVSTDGLIATNLHVLGEARPITVRIADGRRFPVTEVHATDRAHDLALIKVDAQDLPALELGDSDALKQGQSIIAVGNPLGLEHSVVKGIVSGLREDIDGQPMIQLAIPIERGNSGGPVVDLQGRVVGLITLKSQLTRNLGYAVAVNALKPLIEKPNSVPMSRWLTIGRINSREWDAPEDVRWRQRAGRIVVEGRGEGFGGRSLCLCRRELPPRPFEVAVTVRMDQEDGAAGLVFCADGGDKHYGFYPSSGNLRFSRFDGPDVFSWQVLQETKSAHYRPGEWNRLKVRLDDGLIQCYCNGALVFESRDGQYTDGRVGLAKFRHTTAQFKGFEVGEEVRTWRPSPDVKRAITALVDDIPTSSPPAESLITDVLDHADADTAGLVLREHARALQRRAERLRQLASSVHKRAVIDELRRVLDDSEQPADLTHAALLIAYLDNDELDVDAYRRQIDDMAAELREMLPTDADETAKIAALHGYLFEEMGFHGSRTNYHSASNSYLNEVIDDREGLPITLSVLYLGLARRIDLPAEGIGLPGHFVVRVGSGEGVLIDVFDRGKRLSQRDAADKVATITGLAWQDEFLEAQSAADIIIRMLRNLISVANDDRDGEAALRYVSSLLAVRPESSVDRMFRAVVCYNTGRTEQALADVDWLLEREPDDIPLFRVQQLKRLLVEMQQTNDAQADD